MNTEPRNSNITGILLLVLFALALLAACSRVRTVDGLGKADVGNFLLRQQYGAGYRDR
jgi:predicted small secreted protein